jgi:hypothetical protein
LKKYLFGKIQKNHSLAMIICCAIPLTLIVILSLTGTLGSWGFFALMLLCPILHIFMMRGHTMSPGDTMDHTPAVDETKELAELPDVVEINEGSSNNQRRIGVK